LNFHMIPMRATADDRLEWRSDQVQDPHGDALLPIGPDDWLPGLRPGKLDVMHSTIPTYCLYGIEALPADVTMGPGDVRVVERGTGRVLATQQACMLGGPPILGRRRSAPETMTTGSLSLYLPFTPASHLWPPIPTSYSNMGPREPYGAWSALWSGGPLDLGYHPGVLRIIANLEGEQAPRHAGCYRPTRWRNRKWAWSSARWRALFAGCSGSSDFHMYRIDNASCGSLNAATYSDSLSPGDRYCLGTGVRVGLCVLPMEGKRGEMDLCVRVGRFQ
jgi:hypothetical protein